MKPEKQSGDLFKGALILTVAAMLMKILSATYRVPFQNIVGDVGFYIYQQVYPFYGIALVLSTYGFPAVISKLYAEQASLKEKNGTQNVILISAIILSLIGIVGFFILYWGSAWLAEKMDDPQLAVLLKVSAFVFLILPGVSLLRGYFQGRGDMLPTAISQVGEQLIRVLTILFTSLWLTKAGYSLYTVSGSAYLGAVTGGIFAILILLTFLWMRKRKELWAFRKIEVKKSGKIAQALVIQGFAICISSLLLIFIQLADSLNLYSLLVSSGLASEEAKGLKGVYDRGQPLIQLGTVVATSMSLSLVPLISSGKMKENPKLLHGYISLALRISIFIGVAAAIGLGSIIGPTNMMLFENREGSSVLAILCILILLASVIITVSGVLQGLGFVLFPAIVVFCGFGFKYMMNIWLVPTYGTTGAAVSSCIALCLIFIAMFWKLHNHMQSFLVEFRYIMVILGAALVIAIVLKGYLHLTDLFYQFGPVRLIASIQALSAVMIGGIVYLYIVLKGNTFKEEELALLPFGSKLLFFLPKKKRS